MTNREIVAEYNEDAVVFTEDWYDDAIIAVTTEGNAIYDYDRLAEILVEHDKMPWEDAVFLSCGFKDLSPLLYASQKDGEPI